MEVTAEIYVSLKTTKGVKIDLRKLLEVSLDCPNCQRNARTILFKNTLKRIVCTPTKHLFTGEILKASFSRNNESTKILYRIKYETSVFNDSKSDELSVIHPTWARINFFDVTDRDRSRKVYYLKRLNQKSNCEEENNI